MGFSVLLSVYKKERTEYFIQAMQSIWDEQTLKPNEIVLVKDGPLDKELDDAIKGVEKHIGDALKIISLEENVGLGAALNEGLKFCSYELVARMDTDDIALPKRFEKQVSFMNEHPYLAASSAWMEEFDDSGKTIAVRKLPLDSVSIRSFAKRRNPLSHPLTIFRKSIVLSVGGYPEIKK